MDESDFEGTLVLGKLAEIDAVDAFFAAIDSDDAARVNALMRRAGLDGETIAIVLRKIADGDDSH